MPCHRSATAVLAVGKQCFLRSGEENTTHRTLLIEKKTNGGHAVSTTYEVQYSPFLNLPFVRSCGRSSRLLLLYDRIDHVSQLFTFRNSTAALAHDDGGISHMSHTRHTRRTAHTHTHTPGSAFEGRWLCILHKKQIILYATTGDYLCRTCHDDDRCHRTRVRPATPEIDQQTQNRKKNKKRRKITAGDSPPPPPSNTKKNRYCILQKPLAREGLDVARLQSCSAG